jgi:hypothetical protein
VYRVLFTQLRFNLIANRIERSSEGCEPLFFGLKMGA